MKYPSISVDTYDFVLIAAMAGGFWTGEWLPFTVFLVLEYIKAWVEYEIEKGGD